MTPLSDALTTAQRRALAALEDEYVAAKIDRAALLERLEAEGISDPTDRHFVAAALDVMRSWGVAEPRIAARVAAE